MINLFTKRRKTKKDGVRILVEDALKYLYNCEFNNINCTLYGIAKHLSINKEKASKLIDKLKIMSLVTSSGENFKLTDEGKRYALRVVRIHRLLERYLADETSINEIEWHLKAEEEEHHVTKEEADNLAAKLGNPVFDPHGDPIPTASGELPSIKEKPLSSLKPDETARILHIEDEPQEIYTQIVNEGLYPGVHIRIIDSEKNKITFAANGIKKELSTLLTANIFVAPIPGFEKNIKEYIRLSDLPIGKEAVVLAVSKACRGQQRRRLMDLGIVPGTIIKAELKSVGGDPVAYIVRGAIIALRKQQSDQIFIKDLEKENGND